MFEAINKRLTYNVEREIQTKDELKKKLCASHSTLSALCQSSEHSEGLVALELDNEIESAEETQILPNDNNPMGDQRKGHIVSKKE